MLDYRHSIASRWLQPTGQVRVNWNHPLARGLIFAVIYGDGQRLQDLTDASVVGINNNNVAYTIGAYGRGWTGTGGANQHVEFGNLDKFKYTETTSFTHFSAFQRVGSNGNDRMFPTTKDSGQSTRTLVQWKLSSTNLLFGVWGSAAATLGVHSGTTTITDEIPHTGAMVRDVDADQGRIYLDGIKESEATDDSTGTWTVTDGLVGSGLINTTGNSNFTSFMRHFVDLVWTRALTDGEIALLHQDPYGLFEWAEVTPLESMAEVTFRTINVFDTTTPSESVELQLHPILLDVSDATPATEFVDLQFDPLLIDVSDSINVTEFVDIFVYIPVSFAVNDTITVVESVTVQLPMRIDTSDTITVTESIALSSIELFLHEWNDLAAHVEILPHEWDILSDSFVSTVLHEWITRASAFLLTHVWVTIPPEILTLFDDDITFPTNEVHISSMLIQVGDTIPVVESVSFLGVPLAIQVSDAVAITDTMIWSIPIRISVLDSILITEEAKIRGSLFVFDSITATEGVTLSII